MSELGIIGNRVDQEQIRSGQLAGELRRGGALQFLEYWQAHQIGEGCQSPTTPLALTQKLQRTECRPAEHLCRIERRNRDLRVLNTTPPLLKFKTALEDSSLVVTSIFSSCAKAAGDCVRTEKVNIASCGNSLGCPSWMLLVARRRGLYVHPEQRYGRARQVHSAQRGAARPSFRITLRGYRVRA